MAMRLQLKLILQSTSKHRLSRNNINEEKSNPDGNEEGLDIDHDKHVFTSYLLTTNTQASPLRYNLPAPRSQLSRLLLCSHFMCKALSLYNRGFGSAFSMGDS